MKTEGHKSVGWSVALLALTVVGMPQCRWRTQIDMDLLRSPTADSAGWPEGSLPLGDSATMDTSSDLSDASSAAEPIDVARRDMKEVVELADAEEEGSGHDLGPDREDLSGDLPIDWPTPTYCPYQPDDLAMTMQSIVYRAQDFVGSQDLVSLTQPQCIGKPLPDSEERAFGIYVPGPGVELVVRTRCNFDCALWLTHDDCTWLDLQLCNSSEGDEQARLATEPGLYLAFVEGLAAGQVGPFDLQVAVNHTAGRNPCPVAEILRYSEAFNSGCLADGSVTIRRSGSTADSADRFYLHCGPERAPFDPIGGAPDRVYALQLDAGDDHTRTLDIEVRPEGYDTIAAVTAGPCGADQALVACSQGGAGPQFINGITLFAGETLYLIVDGNGASMLDGIAGGSFDLKVSFHEPTCRPGP